MIKTEAIETAITNFNAIEVDKLWSLQWERGLHSGMGPWITEKLIEDGILNPMVLNLTEDQMDDIRENVINEMFYEFNASVHEEMTEELRKDPDFADMSEDELYQEVCEELSEDMDMYYGLESLFLTELSALLPAPKAVPQGKDRYDITITEKKEGEKGSTELTLQVVDVVTGESDTYHSTNYYGNFTAEPWNGDFGYEVDDIVKDFLNKE